MAGLSAAYELASAGVDVVVLEGADRIGGKLQLGEISGMTIDLGAESILARRPEALELVNQIGLTDKIVHPVTSSAAIWTRGTLSAMTTGNVSGGWAWRHHRKWLRELAGRQKVDPAE